MEVIPAKRKVWPLPPQEVNIGLAIVHLLRADTPRLPDLPRGGVRVGWTGGLRGDPLMRSRPFRFDQTWTLEEQADLDAPLEMPLEE